MLVILGLDRTRPRNTSKKETESSLLSITRAGWPLHSERAWLWAAISITTVWVPSGCREA